MPQSQPTSDTCPPLSTPGPSLVWAGKSASRPVAPAPSILQEIGGREPSAAVGWDEWPAAFFKGGLLLHGDNYVWLNKLRDAGFAGQVQLVYIDPPFNSGADYAGETGPRGDSGRATRLIQYGDIWRPDTYLQFMYERLVLLKDLLTPTGSLFLHCDYRTAHHLRCLLDEVFGADRFRNQLVWAYGEGARGAKAVAGQFGRNHDVILWYAKGKTVAYAPVTIARRLSAAEAKRRGFRQDEQGDWFKTAPRGDYTDASIARLEAEGRIYRTRTGTVRIKYPLRSEGATVIEDVRVGDVWTDIPDAMHTGQGEAFAYPTRKPEALLERLLLAASRPGDLVLDAFHGSGTTAAVAQRLGRRWIGCDANRRAIQLAARRVQTALQASAAGPAQASGATELAAAAAPEGFARYTTEPLTVATPADLEVAVERQDDEVIVRIERFDAPAVRAWLAASRQSAVPDDWRALVDEVLIDPAYDGRVMRRLVMDSPRLRQQTVTGIYRLPIAQAATVVAVKLIDLLGYEHLMIKAIPTPQVAG